jgi:hypothetical protein
MQYSCGLALQYLPYFLIAHTIAKPLGYPNDGFSVPYQLAITLGALITACIGLWYTRKSLLNYFSESTTSFSLLFIVFATNYLNFSTIDVGMTHT